MYEIVLGSYEEFILGYKWQPEKSSLNQSFASHSHSASIRCLTHSGTYVATGGADDRIVVYNLKTRKEHCMLTHHNGTVTALRFNTACTHLFSGGQDGIFAITRVGNWQVEKLWEKPHKGAALIDIAVHDTGKLALTLGADGTLRTWNLVKGRQAYIINLTTKCLDPRGLSSVSFAPDGVRFLLSGGRATEVWSINTGGQISVIDHENIKVSSSAWLDDSTILSGLENGEVAEIDVDTKSATLSNTHKAHDSRVKCVAVIKLDSDTSQVVTAASNGEIKIWSDDLSDCLAKVSADCRLTCLSVADVSSHVKPEVTADAKVIDVEEKVPDKPKLGKRKGVVIIERDDDESQTMVSISEKDEKKTKKRKVTNMVEVEKVAKNVDIKVKNVSKKFGKGKVKVKEELKLGKTKVTVKVESKLGKSKIEVKEDPKKIKKPIGNKKKKFKIKR